MFESRDPIERIGEDGVLSYSIFGVFAGGLYSGILSVYRRLPDLVPVLPEEELPVSYGRSCDFSLDEIFRGFSSQRPESSYFTEHSLPSKFSFPGYVFLGRY